MTDETLPTVRLRPKANARAIRHGFPWVYADELVTDRRTKALAPGSLVRLEDAERAPLGVATVNPNSKIIVRMLDTDPAAVIDRGWLAARLARALALRETLFDAPFYRLVHAEADGLPGVVIDRFGDAAVIQPNAAWADRLLPDLAAALAEVTGVTRIVMNGSGRARGLEGLDERTEVIAGAIEAPVEVPMNGAVYLADLTGGQKTGLFYDQRPNHAFAQRLARGGRVLDVFSHVGGFGLAALAGGVDQPANGQGAAAVRTDLDRHLVGRAAHAAAADFDRRGDVVERGVEGGDRLLVLLLVGQDVEGAVDDVLGDGLLTFVHDVVHELGDDQVAELGIRQDVALLGAVTTGHRCILLNLTGRAKAYFGRLAP